MSTPVLLVLGAGSKIGLSVANAFATKGYKVALAARSMQDGVGEDGYLRLQLDLSNPGKIQNAFTKVKAEFGVPTVVVYNGASLRHLKFSSRPFCTPPNGYRSRRTNNARSRRPP
jgi:NAD(P)-dependent dehydrogenase (short-subunit alcohol dehydrogenase family)